jgi:hypothetical protein
MSNRRECLVSSQVCDARGSVGRLRNGKEVLQPLRGSLSLLNTKFSS